VQAVETEKRNTADLLKYVLFEEELKRGAVPAHRRVTGPRAAYLSVARPRRRDSWSRVAAAPDDASAERGAALDGGASPEARPVADAQSAREMEGVVYVAFKDFPECLAYFEAASSRRRRTRRPCAVTGRPACYVDPVTKQPFATAAAFRVLRERAVEARRRRREEARKAASAAERVLEGAPAARDAAFGEGAGVSPDAVELGVDGVRTLPPASASSAPAAPTGPQPPLPTSPGTHRESPLQDAAPVAGEPPAEAAGEERAGGKACQLHLARQAHAASPLAREPLAEAAAAPGAGDDDGDVDIVG
jgi:hypothetical protein